jgi:hypothetical protein
MAIFFEVTRFLFIFDDVDFCRAADFRNRRINLCAFDERSTDSCVRAVINEQNLIEDDGIALFVVAGKFLDLHFFSNRDLILLAAGLYYCKFARFHSGNHYTRLSKKRNVLLGLVYFRLFNQGHINTRSLACDTQNVFVYLFKLFAGVIIVIDDRT